MKNFILGGLVTASLALAATTPAKAQIVSDPAADADCVLALLTLLDQPEIKGDEDGIITIAMYYFGRLGGEGKATEGYLISRMGQFADDENLYLEEADNCVTDFETEAKKFENMGKILDN